MPSTRTAGARPRLARARGTRARLNPKDLVKKGGGGQGDTLNSIQEWMPWTEVEGQATRRSGQEERWGQRWPSSVKRGAAEWRAEEEG